MTTPIKFMFETVFDTDTSPNQPDEPPETLYTEKQYLAAMDQGRMVGMEAGVRNAKEEVDHLATEAMNQLAQVLGAAQFTHEQVLKELRAGSARLAFAIAGKLAGELMRRQPQAEIEQLMAACIDQLIGEPQLKLQVNPDIAEIMKQRIGELVEQTGYAGPIAITPDANLAITECRVEWDNGGSEFGLEELTARISAVVEYYCEVQFDNQILPDLPEDFAIASEEAGDAEPSPEEEDDFAFSAASQFPDDIGGQKNSDGATGNPDLHTDDTAPAPSDTVATTPLDAGSGDNDPNNFQNNTDIADISNNDETDAELADNKDNGTAGEL